MSTQLCPMPKFFALTNTGLPLTGGLLYTCIAGTSTPKATYTDSTGDFANTNPIVLDAAGRADVWIATGMYKFILKDSAGNEIWSVDNIGQDNLLSNTVNTISELRNLTANSAKLVTVLGYSEIGDGGGGMFVWDASNSDDDDGGVTIMPSGSVSVGRWRRLLNEFVTPRMYGAKGDGTTDDIGALQASDDYAQSVSPHIHILLTDGTYFISKPTVTSKMVFGPNAILSWQANMNPVWSVVITDRFKHFNFAATNPSYSPTLLGINEVYPEWFGALGNGSFSNNTKPSVDTDTAAIQAAINTCTTGMWVVFDSSKKYWCGSLTAKEGVNLKGAQCRENDTASSQATEYQANLQFNAASGDFITVANTSDVGQMRGIVIRDLVIDGNALAGSIIKLETNNSLVEYCTIRNGTIGIYLNGTGVRNFINANHIYNCSNGITSSANMTYGIIKDNFIYSCISYAVSVGNGYGWIIDGNTFRSNTNIDITVAGSNVKIINNTLDDISATTGINLVNNAIGESIISGNSISCLTHTGAIGITITTSVVNYVHCNNNSLYQASSIACLGIRSITSGQTLPGNIFDNNIVGFTTPYQLDGGHTTALRYQDAQGLKVYREIVGDSSKLSTYDLDTQNVIINPTGIGTSVGGESPISSEGGYSEGTMIYNRKHLIRTATSASWQGSRIHDAIEFDNTNTTPRTDTRAWYERDPNDGSHHFGDMADELMSLSNSGLSLSTITITKAMTFGGSAVSFVSPTTMSVKMTTDFVSVQKTGNVVYQIALESASIELPTLSGTNYGAGPNSFTRLKLIRSESSVSASTFTIPSSFPASQTIVVPAGLSFQTGDKLIVAYGGQALDTYNPELFNMACTVTSYSGTSLVVSITSAVGSGTTFSAWQILKPFPFISKTVSDVIPCIVQVPTVANTGGNPLSKKVVGAIRMTLGWWIFSAPAIVGTEEGLYESGWPIESLNVDNVKGVVGQTISSLVTLQ